MGCAGLFYECPVSVTILIKDLATLMREIVHMAVLVTVLAVVLTVLVATVVSTVVSLKFV